MVNINIGPVNLNLGGPAVDLVAVFGPQTLEDVSMVGAIIAVGDGPFPLTLTPMHRGKPVAVDGPGRVEFDDPSLFEVASVDSTGTVFQIRDRGQVGTTRGRAIVDARIGPDVLEKTLEFELTAMMPEADQLAGEFGEQVPDEASAPTDPAVPVPAPDASQPAPLGG